MTEHGDTFVSFFVPGTPRPAGSKKAFPTKSGKIAIVDSSGQKGKTWRLAVQYAAREAMNGRPPTGRPVRLWADFCFVRPKSHYRSGKYSHLLKPSAPKYHTIRPDSTKLVRALEDALTNIVWWDDAQVCSQHVSKSYVAKQEPGVTISIAIMNGKEGESDGR